MKQSIIIKYVSIILILFLMSFIQQAFVSYELDLEFPKYKDIYEKTVDGIRIQIKSGFAHFHYDYTPHLQSAETLFKIYKNYRSYFIQKGYLGCQYDSKSVSFRSK